MIETNYEIQENHLRNVVQTKKLSVQVRLIWLSLLLFFLMTPTYGQGFPPYFFIILLSIPIFLHPFTLSLKKEYRFLIIYAIVYLSCLFIHYYSGCIKLSASFIGYFVLSPLIVTKTIKSKKDFASIISIIVAFFSVYAVLGIIETLTGINIIDIVHRRFWDRSTPTRYGLFLSHGFLTLMHNNAILMCMIWAVAAYQVCNVKKHKMLWTICWLLIGVYDLIMLSRLVLLTAPILQFIIFRKRGFQWISKRLFVIISIVLIIIFFSESEIFVSLYNIIGGLIGPIIDEFLGTSLKTYFNSPLNGSGQRFLLWNWIIDAVKDDLLFGKGFTDIWSTTVSGQNDLGQMWYVEKTSIEVHWLMTLYRFGLYGLSGFILFQVRSIVNTWKTKIKSFEDRVSFQYVMKWLTVFYFLHLFGVAAAEELNFFYFLLAIYMSYVSICNRKNR